MSLEKMIRDQNKQISLKEDFNGSIVCKKLLVPLGIKFDGHVIAEEIYVKGQFDGYAQATTFYADESAVLDGVIIAEKVMNKSLNQNVRINTRLFKMVDPLFSTEAQVDQLVDAAVEAALAEALVAKSPELGIEEPDFAEFGTGQHEAGEAVSFAAERLRTESVQFVEQTPAKVAVDLEVERVAISAPASADRSGPMPSLF